MSKKRGLPNFTGMRHDFHFVEELDSQRDAEAQGIGRMIPAGYIDPNPDQPRNRLGDLKDLIASIREKGIIEPLIVRRTGDRYQIISGERRFRAGLEAGLQEFPCIEKDVDEVESLEISLIENLQRKDLSLFEEAQGIAALQERFNYTHEEIAKKIGKSRASITEILSLAKLPENIKALCEDHQITAKSMLLQIARQEHPEQMKELAHKIAEEGYTREEARDFKKAKQGKKVKQASFQFTSPEGDFVARITFKKKKVGKDEVLDAINVIKHCLDENVTLF